MVVMVQLQTRMAGGLGRCVIGCDGHERGREGKREVSRTLTPKIVARLDSGVVGYPVMTVSLSIIPSRALLFTLT